MRLARVRWNDQVLEGIVEGRLFRALGPEGKGREIPLEEVRLLPPCTPSKIVAVGLNYRDHLAESQTGLEKPPTEPFLFWKPPSALIGPEEPIRIPAWAGRVDYEGELGVVIGKEARNLTAAHAHEAILGYTIVNDVTARDIQRRERTWVFAKGMDTFCPAGPWIETELNPQGLRITTRVNGEVRQQGNTADMIFTIGEILAYITRAITLMPGDLVLTGTPAGVGPLHDGDLVEVEIEGIGTLRNPVRVL